MRVEKDKEKGRPKLVCVWVGGRRGGDRKWWLTRKDDGWWGRRGRLLLSSKLISQQMFLSAVKNGAAKLSSRLRPGPPLRLPLLSSLYQLLSLPWIKPSNPFPAAQPFSRRTPVLWQRLITASSSWLSAHFEQATWLSQLPWKPPLDYCSALFILHRILCLLHSWQSI